MQYIIHHATGEYRFTETIVQDRKIAGTVEAESLDQAYYRSQNLMGNWNESCRSTSVGDVIQEGNKFYLVCNLGFKEILDLHYSDAFNWMWYYCINLGKYTDNDGNHYDLGVFESKGMNSVSAAIVYDNIPGSYRSGKIMRNGKDFIMFEDEVTIETLKRYKEHLKLK